MSRATIRVPSTLLKDLDLTPTAKLLWLYCQVSPEQEPITRAGLVARSGLAPDTVMRGLAHLHKAGWLSPPVPAESWAFMPTDLLRDRRLGVREKLLYPALQLRAGYFRSGQFKYPELAAECGASLNTIKRAACNLNAAGWLSLSQAHKYSPVRFTLRNPVLEHSRRQVNEVKRRLKKAQYKGEAIMREYLTLLVDTADYEDDGSPGYLVNPYTKAELHFDRYYPPGVAIEFQGPQHDGPTTLFPDREDADTRRARDLIKLGICLDRGIHLIRLYPRDLSLATIRQKVADLLPMANLDGAEAVIDYLEKVSRGYRAEA